MTRFVIRRLVHAVIVIAVVMTTVFLSVRVTGDPVRLLLPIDAPTSEAVSMRHSLGLDRPLIDQYGSFVSDAVRGNFGTSLWQRVPAFGLAVGRLGPTMLLASCALLLGLCVGGGIGLVAAAYKGKPVDQLLTVPMFAAVSLVEFWSALMLIYIFAVKFRILPTSGYGSFSTLVLPTIALAVRPAGRIAQFTRTAIAEELDKPYVRAATARGLSRPRIVLIHALKNAGVALVTLVGDEYIAVISSTVIIEVIFAWPGLGSLLLQSVQHRDMPLVVACTFLFTLIIVGINLAEDLSYGLLDKRARVV